jgi:C-terminal processing protease CtpA/Prc
MNLGMKSKKVIQKTWLLASAFFLMAGVVQAQTLNSQQKRMLTTVESIALTFEEYYAPKEWKKKHLNWDLAQNTQVLREKIVSNPSITVREFQLYLKQYIESFADYHVGIRFQNTEAATLPFLVMPVENKFIVVSVDPKQAPADKFPVEVGAELVSLDGKSASDLVNDLLLEMGSKNSEKTDLALAAIALTQRKATRGVSIPKGLVMIEVKNPGAESSLRFQYTWDHKKELISYRDNPQALNLNKAFSLTPRLEYPLASRIQKLAHKMMSPFALDSLEKVHEKFLLGARKSYIPRMGKVIWESKEDSIFDAYIAMDANRKFVGVVRIPSYTPDDPSAAIKEFKELISMFNDRTDALVVDQINNPGGSVFYLYSLASILAKSPLYTPKHKMILTPADILEAQTVMPELEKITTDEEAVKAIGEEVGGYPVSYVFILNVKNYFQFLIDEWKAGKKITDPYFIWGVDQINPASGHYTKPVMVVTNALDFSGGDFFPAILQDNAQAKIFGTRTAGAGGYVLSQAFPNNLGIELYSITGSYAERKDLNPIENLGVTPDLTYDLKISDVTQGFTGYAQSIFEAALGMIK